MLSDPSPYGFLHNPQLPSEEAIVNHCSQLGFPSGTALLDSSASVIAWIRCGPDVTLGEARTQDWAAQALRTAGASDILVPRVYHAFTADYRGLSIGYIAMEYIESINCKREDVELIAKAIEALIGLQAPAAATLGHMGGGTKSIVHSFFPEWLPNAHYRTDQDFYAHIHNILKFLRIDFRDDIDLSSYGRYLCPSDFNRGNFKKCTMGDGRLVVVVSNFHATCFMPIPFIEVALKKPRDPFSQLVVQKITNPYQPSGYAGPLIIASALLHQYGVGPVALPSGVHARRGHI
ncbi:hypothetical protein BKA82DRAFT_997670 [Pisolithus tinctorius]|uniref:Aminoglycoside phosphotransferase domain-containing protein n=1 Tax=Pisolithus tinctorius Marx 270 TaxID=870435 RepID=A0A0C3PHR0_PISTI|nr:hypothetical protein BKA82DRAFT_997670 [Pisolithus tinctorius]KIO08016.1 hypothetical protein M404DRAFT_997670 [Pisolithus tinctorius Marx 270]